MDEIHLTAWDVAGFIESELAPDRLEWVWNHVNLCYKCMRWVAAVLSHQSL